MGLAAMLGELTCKVATRGMPDSIEQRSLRFRVPRTAFEYRQVVRENENSPAQKRRAGEVRESSSALSGEYCGLSLHSPG